MGQTRPTTRQLVRHVHELSSVDTHNVRMDEPHFQQSMSKRDIDMRSVLEVLRHGRGVGNPSLDEYGDWRIRMVRKVAGRSVEVTLAVCADHVVCITAW